MKRAVAAVGVATPAWIQISDPAAASRSADLAAAEGLRYPLIVKHPSGYSSVGMGRDSRVERPEDLEAQVRF